MINMAVYGQQRPRIQTGDLLAFQGRSLLSRGVQVVSRSPWSHVAVCVWIKFAQQLRLMLCHALYPTGVCFMNVSQYLTRYDGEATLFPLKRSLVEASLPHAEEQFADWLAQQSGRGYDTGGAGRHLLRFLPERAGQFYCSELAAALFAHFGLGVMAHPRPDQVLAMPLVDQNRKVAFV